MKQLMMTMGLCLMTATVMGQKGAGLSTMEEGRQGGVYRTKARTMEIHAEVVARQQSNTTLVRFIVDESYKMLTRDQDLIKSVEAASTFRFRNAMEAMNTAASHGWELRSTYVIRGRTGDETHFVMVRSIEITQPYSPWLDRGKRADGKK